MPRVGSHFEYLYDFGDSWRHDLLLEAILMPQPNAHYPRCVAGERRTPPEDVSGTLGYEDYLAAIADPTNSEHESMLLWRRPLIPKHSLLPPSTNASRKRSVPANRLQSLLLRF